MLLALSALAGALLANPFEVASVGVRAVELFGNSRKYLSDVEARSSVVVLAKCLVRQGWLVEGVRTLGAARWDIVFACVRAVRAV